MKHHTTYIPNDLGYDENGYPMERKEFDAMVKEIFEKGKVTNIFVHSYQQMMSPDWESKTYYYFSRAVTVKVEAPIEIEYTIHINKLNPIRIIEVI